MNLLRDTSRYSCERNYATAHQFSSLRNARVNISTILHSWKSSLEQVERYSRYLNDLDQTDGYLCECIHMQSFGKHCEYQLPFETTFEATIQSQFNMKLIYSHGLQNYGSIVCYKTLRCKSGVLCIDWREICDGIQQCEYGYDEWNCDLLEMNRCDEGNEYRCMNGMCIPDEYFLDGEFDCLNWSDEIQFKNDKECIGDKPSAECDDRLCQLRQWSCGDGQCISDRWGFQKELSSDDECVSRREQYFMCEMNAKMIQWTMPNGLCDLSEEYTEPPTINRNESEQCEYLLKCALSQGVDKGCPCLESVDCVNYFQKNCTLEYIRYPAGGILGAYGSLLFIRDQLLNYAQPHLISINGTIRCRDALVTIRQDISFNTSWSAHRLVEEIFCSQKRNTSFSQIIPHMITDRCSRLDESTNICNESHQCLSITRLRDGFSDCLNGMDGKVL
ncbi:unnamed protein product [Rotaria magnacalcarata]|uniref:Uncharacterized protein n=1 Tax=Rotaria magnacalcarata TaxID=392030 RepID=A0A816TN00_9BILA|nr:unnamed protein product [Rotaria magnacalcarata]CAF3890472.1 unnamed protein product [Rotaria magnacalcarata]